MMFSKCEHLLGLSLCLFMPLAAFTQELTIRNIGPVISPNGKEILFLSNRVNGKNGIYKIGIDGKHEKRLSRIDDEDYRASWSPDGNSIVFHAPRGDEGGWDLIIMDSEGKNQRFFTQTKEKEYDADWSPDGKSVVFGTSRNGSSSEIFTRDIKTGEEVLITNDEFLNTSPAWSPDGSKIAYMSLRNGKDFDLMVVDLQTNESYPIAETNSGEYFPHWFPSGDKILYGVSHDTKQWELWVVNAAGTSPTLFASSGGLGWSIADDEQTVVIAKNAPDGSSDLFLMTINGIEIKKITGN